MSKNIRIARQQITVQTPDNTRCVYYWRYWRKLELRQPIDAWKVLSVWPDYITSQPTDLHVTSCLVGIAETANANLSLQPTSLTLVKDFLIPQIHSTRWKTIIPYEVKIIIKTPSLSWIFAVEQTNEIMQQLVGTRNEDMCYDFLLFIGRVLTSYLPDLYLHNTFRRYRLFHFF